MPTLPDYLTSCPRQSRYRLKSWPAASSTRKPAPKTGFAALAGAAAEGVPAIGCADCRVCWRVIAGAFGAGSAPTFARTLGLVAPDLGQHPVSRFDLTKARSTPRVLLAPRG